MEKSFIKHIQKTSSQEAAHLVGSTNRIIIEFTFGKFMVNGTVRTANTLDIFFMVPATGFPSKPSCVLHWETIAKTHDSKIGPRVEGSKLQIPYSSGSSPLWLREKGTGDKKSISDELRMKPKE